MAKVPHKTYDGAKGRKMGERHGRQEHLDKNSYPIGPTGIGGSREEMDRLGSYKGRRASGTGEGNKHAFQSQIGLLGEDMEHLGSNDRDKNHDGDRAKRLWP